MTNELEDTTGSNKPLNVILWEAACQLAVVADEMAKLRALVQELMKANSLSLPPGFGYELRRFSNPNGVTDFTCSAQALTELRQMLEKHNAQTPINPDQLLRTTAECSAETAYFEPNFYTGRALRQVSGHADIVATVIDNQKRTDLKKK